MNGSLLHGILGFFNPPILDNPIGLAVKFMIAVGSLGLIFAFEGGTRILMVLLSVYFWGTVICTMITISLVARGAL